MGLKAIVDYAFIKEVCEYVKRDGSNFTGKVKGKIRKYEPKADTVEKVNQVKRLLVSRKRKSKAENKPAKKAPRKIEKFRQTPESSPSDSDSGSGDSSGDPDSNSDSDDAAEDISVGTNTTEDAARNSE